MGLVLVNKFKFLILKSYLFIRSVMRDCALHGNAHVLTPQIRAIALLELRKHNIRGFIYKCILPKFPRSNRCSGWFLQLDYIVPLLKRFAHERRDLFFRLYFEAQALVTLRCKIDQFYIVV